MKRNHILLLAVLVMTACDESDDFRSSSDPCVVEVAEVDASCGSLVSDDLPDGCDLITVTGRLDLSVTPEMVVLLDGEVVETNGSIVLEPARGSRLEVNLAPVAVETIPCDPAIMCCLPREKIIDIKTKPIISGDPCPECP